MLKSSPKNSSQEYEKDFIVLENDPMNFTFHKTMNLFYPILRPSVKRLQEPRKVPILIKNIEISRLWYKKNDTFWVPKANFNCRLG